MILVIVFMYDRGQIGWTPLHRAARDGHLPVVKELVWRGADPDHTNKVRGEVTGRVFESPRVIYPFILVEVSTVFSLACMSTIRVFAISIY